jgi:hypothetical protein
MVFMAIAGFVTTKIAKNTKGIVQKTRASRRFFQVTWI